jgi:hypothetical protein
MLKIKWNPDDDGNGELSIEASANGFSGRGSAWFAPTALQNEADKFSQFPIPEDNLPIIQGGFWSKDVKEQLEQEHVFLSLRPLNRTGHIVFMVRLASERYSKQRDGDFKVELQIETNYEELRLFPQRMRDLLEGTLPELILGQENA